AVTRVLKEFRLANCADLGLGDTVSVEIFAEGDKVDVTGISKGKGYAGTVKRFGTHRGPMAHGSKYHRGPGSMGACSTPSKVMKGKKLPGHMGVDRVTVQNLDIVKVDSERNLLLVKGAVPGARGSIVTVKDTVKK
ncbi:MAG: 50S ribosomal protein L3, partial [Clostridia bacterium]|nr:50S ribosomal protein L3 [Clostridia bacterium]